jgi:hypothetical protein
MVVISLTSLDSASPYDTPLVRELGVLGAKADHSLVWIQYPSKFTEACDYVSYGNEPTLETCYVAAAVIVEIPAFGAATRTGAAS